MSPRRLLSLIFLLLALPVAPATLAGTELHCPASLPQRPPGDAVPPGWSLRGAVTELHLQRAAFYDGDPAGLGPLAPVATHRVGRVETSTWLFEGTESERVWIGCLYRDATAVVARPLPPGLHECTTTLRLNALGDPAGPISIECH